MTRSIKKGPYLQPSLEKKLELMISSGSKQPIKTWSSLFERAVYQSNKIHELALNDPNNFMLITSQQDIKILLARRLNNPEIIGGLIGTEGSHALDGELNNIEKLYDQGFRMMSLQHFFDRGINVISLVAAHCRKAH